MYAESPGLNQLQLAEGLLKDCEISFSTLHNLILVNMKPIIIVTDQDQTITADMWEVSTGDTETQLKVLRDFFFVFEIGESFQCLEKNVTNKIIPFIKNLT